MQALVSPTRVLIVGGDSLLGSSLGGRLRAEGISVTRTTRRCKVDPAARFLDLSKPLYVDSLGSFDVAVLCAGVTSTSVCQADRELSRRVNVDRTIELARRLSYGGTQVVFLSSSLVFDGNVQYVTADTAKAPQCEYGRQKADAEEGVLGGCRDVTIVRLSKVISSRTPLFKGWLESLHSRRTIEAFPDVRFSPISLSFAVEVLSRIVKSRALGIFQASASDEISYADACGVLVRVLGVSSTLVRPVLGCKTGVYTFPQHTTLAPCGLDRLRLTSSDSATALASVANDWRLYESTLSARA